MGDTTPGSATDGVARRTVLKGLGAAGLAAVAVPALATGRAVAGTTAPPPPPVPVAPSASASEQAWLHGFATAVREEFARQGLVGGAVVLVSSDRVLSTLPLGVRTLGSKVPVDADTHFFVASTTKSMAAAQVATWVDSGLLDWDQPAHDVWPAFRAPTASLTSSLRVRDLLGMGSGLAAAEADDLHQGDITAQQLLQGLVDQRVVAPPDTEFIYDNPLFVTGAYLPLLHRGVGADALTGTWAVTQTQRVWGPAGMGSTVAADDPRGRVTDYATGNGLDVTGTASRLPFVGAGSSAPAGAGVSTPTDMGTWVRLQLRQGRSTTGAQVVSAANLAECWRPHVDIPVRAAARRVDPDLTSAGYGMGWITNTYRDGTTLIWHNGAVDGFSAYVGFVPRHDVGVVVLTSMNPDPTGLLFYQYVVDLVLARYGLNTGGADAVHQVYLETIDQLRTVGATARRVPPDVASRYVGRYEKGYELDVVSGQLVVRLGARRLTVKARPDGTYVHADGLVVGAPATLSADPDGTPRVVVAGIDSVRRTGLL